MRQRATALGAMLTLSLALAACGGSAEQSTGGEAVEPTAPAQAVPATAQVEPAPTQAPADTPQTTPTPAGDASGQAAADDPTKTAEYLRDRTMRLWEVYNTHDLDALKAFYEESYWSEKEEEIRSDMQPFKLFGVSIEAEETSPPTEVSPGKWETKHVGRFPLGSVNMVFVYEEFGGEWLLTYAEAE